MANPFTVAVPNALEALMAGEQGFAAGRGFMDDRAKRAAREEAAQSVMQGGDTRGALARLLQVNDTEGAKILAQNAEARGVFGTPIYGTDDKGNTVLGAITKSGAFQRIDTGGVTPTPGVRMLDTGTGYVPVSSKTGQPVAGDPYQPGQPGVQAPGAQPGQPRPRVGYIAKDVQGEAQQKKLGTEIGEKQAGFGQAQTALQSSEATLDRLKMVANRIKRDPALSRVTGWMGVLPNAPGGKAANVQAQLNTLKSQVAFGVLQAMRDASKTGGALGAVSDAEGRRLENNLAALDQAQDAPAFQKAMDDIIRYVDETKPRLRSAFQQDYARVRPGGSTPAATGQSQPYQVPPNMTPDQIMKMGLPSGTPLILPDGTPGVVP